MADIIYTYKNEVYANITNKCDCACTFCIRSQKDAIGDATSLWHTVDPTYDEIIAAIDAFDFTGYEEFVFCGYGEPTCALNILEKTAKYVKEKYKLPIVDVLPEEDIKTCQQIADERGIHLKIRHFSNP